MENLRGTIFQEIRDLDDRISVEEIDLLEKKQVMKEMLKERRSTEVEEERATVVAVSGVTRMAVAGSRSSEKEGHLFSADVGVRRKGAEDTVAAGCGVTPMAVTGVSKFRDDG